MLQSVLQWPSGSEEAVIMQKHVTSQPHFYFVSWFCVVLQTFGNHLCLPLFKEETSSVTETHLTSREQWVSFLDKPTGKQQPMWRNEIALQMFPGMLSTNWYFFSRYMFCILLDTKQYRVGEYGSIERLKSAPPADETLIRVKWSRW